MIVGRTERLLLRQWREDDAKVFTTLFTDPRIVRFTATKAATDAEAINELRKRVREAEQRGWGSWAVVQNETQQVIGSCGFGTHTFPIPSIGWRIVPEFWSNGFATEAALGALEIGFNNHGFHRVDATCHTSNLASIRVMQKIGMRLIDESNSKELLRYSILAATFGVKSNLP